MASVHFATGGTAPNPTSVGWLDFTGNILLPGQTVHIVNSINGGYQISLDVTNNGNPNSNYLPIGLTTFMPIGYTGVGGQPGYVMSIGASGYAEIDYTNIKVTDYLGNPVPWYRMVAGDGEYATSGEVWNVITSGAPWAWVTTLPVAVAVPPGSFVGVGTTHFAEIGNLLNGAAVAVISTDNATAITFTTNTLATQAIDLGVVGPFINVSKTTQPYASIGDVLTYTIPVTNSSDQPMTNVSLIDTLPNGVTYDPNTLVIDGVTTPGQAPPNITLTNLAPGQTTTVVFKVVVTTLPNPNPMNNQAIAQATSQGSTVSSQPTSAITTVNYAPLDITKSVDSSQVIGGETLTYTIVVDNPGNTTANNVVLFDSIPASTTYVNGSLTGAVGAPSTGIVLGSVGPGQVNTITFQVTVDQPPTATVLPNSTNGSYNYVTNNPFIGSTTIANGISNTVTTNVVTVAVKGTKSVSQNYGTVGDTLTYTISVPNTGTIDANNVVLTDTLPPGIVYVPNSVTVNGAPAAGTPSTGIQVGTVPAGTTAIITFQANVASIPPGGFVPNTANGNFNYVVDSTTLTGAINTNTVVTTIADATIATSKSVDKTQVVVGETLTYTVTLNLQGNTTANNVIFLDTLANGLTYVPDSMTVNGVPQPGANPTVLPGVNLTSLPTPGVYTIKFNAVVTTLPDPNPIDNSAKVNYTFTTNPAAPNTNIRTDITNTVSTTVSIADLTGITKSADRQYADCGDIITYTVVIPNTGNVPATQVVMQDTIPANTVFVDNSVVVNGTPVPGANPENGIALGTIGVGQSATVTFAVQVVC